MIRIFLNWFSFSEAGSQKLNSIVCVKTASKDGNSRLNELNCSNTVLICLLPLHGIVDLTRIKSDSHISLALIKRVRAHLLFPSNLTWKTQILPKTRTLLQFMVQIMSNSDRLVFRKNTNQMRAILFFYLFCRRGKHKNLLIPSFFRIFHSHLQKYEFLWHISKISQ